MGNTSVVHFSNTTAPPAGKHSMTQSSAGCKQPIHPEQLISSADLLNFFFFFFKEFYNKTDYASGKKKLTKFE